MPLRYPATVRRQIAQRLRSGEPVVAIAADNEHSAVHAVPVEAPGADRLRE